MMHNRFKVFNSINTNEMMHNMATQKEEVKTFVWWDINSCSVPEGYDVRLVGPSIELALKKAGYSRPLIITAIGNLKHIFKHKPDVLRAIFSTGICLKYIENRYKEIFDNILDFVRDRNPANLMVISGGVEDLSSCLSLLQQKFGHTILHAYPKKEGSCLVNSKDWLWETLLKEAQVFQEKSIQMREPRWVCNLCESAREYFDWLTFDGQTFEDFATHLKRQNHVLIEFGISPLIPRKIDSSDSHPKHATTLKGSIEEEERNPCERMSMATQKNNAKTLVWWDINNFPVPDGYDARLVGPSIESALKKAGYSGLLTITAIGNLNPLVNHKPDVLRAISSTGIRVKHVPHRLTYIWLHMSRFPRIEDSLPANVMIISGRFVNKDVSSLEHRGHTILWAFPQKEDSSSLLTSKEWLWETLLKESQVLQKKCIQMREPLLVCGICEFDGQNIEDCTTHLKSIDHQLREFKTVSRTKRWKLAKLSEYSSMHATTMDEIGYEPVDWDRKSI